MWHMLRFEMMSKTYVYAHKHWLLCVLLIRKSEDLFVFVTLPQHLTRRYISTCPLCHDHTLAIARIAFVPGLFIKYLDFSALFIHRYLPLSN